MVDDTLMAEVRPIVEPAHFFTKAGEVYAACVALWEQRAPINQLTVARELGEKLTEVRLEYLSKIITDLPSPEGVEWYARKVRDYAQRRALIQAGGELVASGHRDNEPDRDAKALATVLAAIGTGAQQTKSLWSRLPQIAESARRSLEPGAVGIRTGIGGLDKVLGGLRPGRVHVVASRTSVGKSSLLTHMGMTAVKENHRTMTVSLEMDDEEIFGERVLLQAVAGLNPQEIRQRGATDGELRALDSAEVAVAGWPGEWVIDDSGSMSVERLRAIAEREKAKGLELLIVDYLQLMRSAKKSDSRYREVGEISRGLKEIALSLSLPVLAAAQLNRDAEGQHPSIHHLRESGDIEHDADVIMLLFRCAGGENCPEKNDMHLSTAPPDAMYIRVGKNRGGATNDAITRYDPALSRWGV